MKLFLGMLFMKNEKGNKYFKWILNMMWDFIWGEEWFEFSLYGVKLEIGYLLVENISRWVCG